MTRVPLAVLDLVPVSSGSDAAQSLRNSIDLSRRAEELGYARYWYAEHHLNPGVAGASPAVVIALTAAATSTIRLGSGAVQMGHRTALSTVEEFGLIDALHPGRLDLGLGRSPGGPPKPAPGSGTSGTGLSATGSSGPQSSGRRPARGTRYAPNGLLLPPPFTPDRLLKSPRLAMQKGLLQPHDGQSQEYADQVADVLALLAGTYRSAEGVAAHPVPGEGAQVQVWILGSSGGESANVAGQRGLRFAANYHISPSLVIDAVEGYRAAFTPSAGLDRPYVSVSADVVVGRDEASARELATGYGLWVRSIRTGEGAIAFPTPEEARRFRWDDDDRALVQDRLDTQLVGSAAQVADRLEQLQEATGADELVVTTITHDHADRVRSFELLAQEWATR
jgi:alkanesulfonate monooxygenase SsuD/methylene tetrahydromethanopterin reductase-like flavin-dependent oxidoreductase (luciferase family)